MPKVALLLLLISSPAFTQSRDERWRQDLQYLVEQITTKHPNAFTVTTRAQFDEAVRALNGSIPQRTDFTVVAEMQRILASVGDAHTNIYFTGITARLLPVRLRWFSEGLFVTQAAEDYSPAIGKKVLRIGTKTAEEAYLAVRNYISYENDPWARLLSSDYLIRPDILAVAGVIAASGPVPVVIDDGKGGTLEYTLPVASFPLLPGPQLARPKNPLYLRNPGQYYWFEYLPEQRTLYFKYNRCRISPALPFDEFTRDFVEFASSNPVDRMVIDLRNNSGGASGILLSLLEALGQAAFAGKFFPTAGFFAIIGRETFSSGTLNARDLRLAGGQLVGEDTGGGASGFGEVVPFTLPNSGVSGQISTKKFESADAPGTTIEPDVRVDLTAADYFSERDPVLEKVLQLRFVPVLPTAAYRR
jgi:hypothetical protein